MKNKSLNECLANSMASFKKTVSVECWGRGSVTTAEIQTGYFKQRGNLTYPEDKHPSL